MTVVVLGLDHMLVDVTGVCQRQDCLYGLSVSRDG